MVPSTDEWLTDPTWVEYVYDVMAGTDDTEKEGQE